MSTHKPSQAHTGPLANPKGSPTETVEERITRASEGLPRAIPIDSHALMLKQRLAMLDFDHPDYEVISQALDEAYKLLEDGQSHYVPF